jgi:multiple sugar transport system substrate-binding protein
MLRRHVSPYALSLPRRRVLQLGVGAAGAALLSACTPDVEEAQKKGQEGGGGDLVFLSTQLQPVEEAEAMRNSILADFEGPAVEFIGVEGPQFHDRLRAEARAGNVQTSLVGGEHGDLVALAADDLLMDLSDMVEELSDANINPEYLEMAKLGGNQVLYIPWMSATYVMAARQEAMDLLDGDPQALTYDQVLAWAKAIQQNQGGRGRFGLPLGEDGLIHRFLQGHLYPSFTGALNTTFRSPEAEQAWNWVKQVWTAANPQSTGYAFMQEPLQSGEVWLAWDHVVRLKDAFAADPDGFVAMPSPKGPKGLGYMAVVAGLGIPKNAPNVDGAKEVIRYLLKPETGALTLQTVSFFPPTADASLPGDVDPGLKEMADVVAAQSASPDAVASLLPQGLGEQDKAYNDVFTTSFTSIVLRNQPVKATLQSQGDRLQQLLDQANAPCWQPDPDSNGPCQVG